MATLTRDASLFDPIAAHASADPTGRAFVFVKEGGVDLTVTRMQLMELAARQGDWLAEQGVGPGEGVLLAIEHGLDLVTTFLGAIRRGIIPCILPTHAGQHRHDTYLKRMANATERIAARAIVRRGPDGSGLIADRMASPTPDHRRQKGIAFIQLTSGTTGKQRAIAVTHDALCGLVRARNAAFDLQVRDVIVGWLPLYHDLGLVGTVLTPLVSGIPSVLISPFEWLVKPAMLMTAIHRYGGTVCNMPNFAFSYCARQIADDDMRGLDLSHWRVLCNSAEPVHPESFKTFGDRFARWGFQASAFAAAYGLAENTLTATMTSLGSVPRVDRVLRAPLQQRQVAELASTDDVAGAAEFVSCGAALNNAAVRIESASGEALADRCVGEIVIKSDSLCDGYYRDEEQSQRLFRDGWLHTGDLGYLVDGELFVCGRLKDVIIVRGAKVYAEEVERAVAAVDGLRPGRVVAFGIGDGERGTEQVVIVAERRDGPRSDPSESSALTAGIERRMRRAIKTELGIAVQQVAFVPSGWIVKTTSGKLARAENKAKWIEACTP
jgi:acyl-CoA synthetase (AMP-forming)/AMP-acid ligase II